MSVIRISLNHQKHLEIAADLAVSYLRRGGIIIYPTETCYGIGADATNPDAVKKVIKIKKMSKDKPISIICSDISMIKKYAVLDDKAKKLIRQFMPGPLTLILKKKNIPDIVSKSGSGLRISSHPLARLITKKLGRPITATSANIHKEPPLYSVEHLGKTLAVDFVIDVGRLPRRKPSTIFDTRTKKIIRRGPITLKNLTGA